MFGDVLGLHTKTGSCRIAFTSRDGRLRIENTPKILLCAAEEFSASWQRRPNVHNKGDLFQLLQTELLLAAGFHAGMLFRVSVVNS